MYDSRPLLPRYVWCVTWCLHSSCCSETQYTHVHFKSFYRPSNLHVTQRDKTYQTLSLLTILQVMEGWVGPGNEATIHNLKFSLLVWYHSTCCSSFDKLLCNGGTTCAAWSTHQHFPGKHIRFTCLPHAMYFM